MPTLYTALRARHRVAHHPPLAADLNKTSTLRTGILANSRQEALRVAGIDRDAKFAAEVKDGGSVEPIAAAPRARREIGIIGAGLAGLCAAYELAELGYRVTVFEARVRVGGRVESLSNFAADKVVEGGGELIGSNHPLWNAYRVRFGLEFSDVKEYENSPFRIGHHTLTFEQSEELTKELDKALKAISDLAESVIDPFEPWTNPDASKLDSQSLSAWLEQQKFSKRCKYAVEMMLAADNGIPADEQSLLGVLAMVKGGGLDRYWLDTEVYRCEGGNDLLAKSFQDELSKNGAMVRLGCAVFALRKRNDRVGIEFRDLADKTEEIQPQECIVDDVILAVPPSVWNKIDVSEFPDLAAIISNPPEMGANVKALMRLTSRFWEHYGSSPTLSEDGPVDLTWETTEADRKKEFVMVAFSGASDAAQCLAWPEAERREKYVGALSDVYPRLNETMDGFEFMPWPRTEWTMASYYFPRCGEVLRWGPLWNSGYNGWLHFAGEHTSFEFVGYMEGALSSGYRLARKLAIRDSLLLA